MKSINESIKEFEANENKKDEQSLNSVGALPNKKLKEKAKIKQIKGSGTVRENNGYDGIIDNLGKKPTWFYFLTTKDNKVLRKGDKVTFDIDDRGNAINLKKSE
ncbi:MAG: hypothetical protein HRU18_01610 [Pseudoalteromonas sp.]|uniref:hypothetical protein n=1 Tax=Pseudoalteromonas sp. TaxID=53249 RepID=UPI001DBC1F66|nr:hypothetical protein [Pseudoalteromonas sp.]NRA76878.1 hypothetical protein [Pseudoalteromonas sp.]